MGCQVQENSNILLTIFSGLITYWYVIPIVIVILMYKKYKSIQIDDSIESENIHKQKHAINKRELKEKNDLYEAYVCNLYKNSGYTIAEHGKDNSIYDLGIDIIALKDKELLFIQCKDWDVKIGNKINHKDIQYIRMNVRDYLEKNPLFKDYKWKIIYITSADIFDQGANHKIIEHSEEIEHKIIPME